MRGPSALQLGRPQSPLRCSGSARVPASIAIARAASVLPTSRISLLPDMNRTCRGLSHASHIVVVGGGRHCSLPRAFSQPQAEILANADVKKLTAAGVRAGAIITNISVSEADFDTFVDALNRLASAGVGTPVLER